MKTIIYGFWTANTRKERTYQAAHERRVHSIKKLNIKKSSNEKGHNFRCLEKVGV